MWPVTGQGFQNTKWTAVLYSQYISQIEKIQLNQTIISSDPEMLYLWAKTTNLVYAGLRKWNHVLWHFSLTAGQGVENTKWHVKFTENIQDCWSFSQEHPTKVSS